MTILITGATGFVGGHLIDHLRCIQPEATLVGWGRSASRPTNLDHYLIVDLTDYLAVRRACEALSSLQCVYHLAGAMMSRTSDEMWRVNVEGTATLLLALAEKRLSDKLRFLNVGSAAQYLLTPAGRGLEETDLCGGVNPYGRSKWVQEVIAFAAGRQATIEVIGARCFNLIGPRLSSAFVAGNIVEQIKAARSNPVARLRLGSLSSERDFVDVRDAVAAYERLAKLGRPGVAYNVCTGIPTKVAALTRMATELSGALHVRVDEQILKRDELDSVYGSNIRLKLDTGWTPKIPIKDSLAAMLA